MNRHIEMEVFLGRHLPGRLPRGGQMMFLKIAGSHSHNLAMPESDVDFLGVYAAPTKAMLSLNPPAETVDGDKPDFSIHEVGKFARLLLKGNPNIVEALFTERMVAAEETFWPELLEHRMWFLSQQAVKQYLGYCQGQLRKLTNGSRLHATGGEYNTKWAYHMVRLAEDAFLIVCGGHPQVWKEGTERESLLAIRRGEWSQERVEKHVRSLIAKIDERRPWKNPEFGPDVFLNDWLLRVREALWQESIPLSLKTRST